MRRSKKSETYFCTVVRRSATSLRTFMYHNKLGCEVRSRIQVSGLASCYTVTCNVVLRAYSRLTASCASRFYAFIARNVHTEIVIWRSFLSVCFTKTKEMNLIVETCNRYCQNNLLNPTRHVMHLQFNIQQLYALTTLHLCFVFIWKQTATCATYSINWLVFITEMKSVYCAVRTGSLNKAVCASYLKG